MRERERERGREGVRKKEKDKKTDSQRDKDRSKMCQKEKMDCGMFPLILCVYECVCV